MSSAKRLQWIDDFPVWWLDGNCNISEHTEACSPFYKHGLTLTPAWICDYLHYNVWDEVTYHFQTSTVELINNFTPHFIGHVLIYPYWDQHQTMLVNKMGLMWRIYLKELRRNCSIYWLFNRPRLLNECSLMFNWLLATHFITIMIQQFSPKQAMLKRRLKIDGQWFCLNVLTMRTLYLFSVCYRSEWQVMITGSRTSLIIPKKVNPS